MSGRSKNTQVVTRPIVAMMITAFRTVPLYIDAPTRAPAAAMRFCSVPSIDDATPAIRGNGSSASTVAFDISIAIVNMNRQTADHTHQNGAASSQAITASCALAKNTRATPSPMSCSWSKRKTSHLFAVEPMRIDTPAHAKIRP